MWKLGIIFSTFLAATFGKNDIVIVGAGLSGISAAAKLMERGYNDITILEAENRIGGRIHTVPFNDIFIDLGAQWVHGEKGNSIYELVNNDFNFGSSGFANMPSTFLLSDSSLPDQKKCQRISNLLFSYLDASEEQANFEGSLGDFIHHKLKQNLTTPKYSDIEQSLVDLTTESFHKQMNGYFAATSWFDISSKVGSQYEDAEGDLHLTWRGKGYSTVFDYITKKAPNPENHLDVQSKILFNKKVTNIKYDLSNSDEKISIECIDGSKYLADHVIFTASLGVLKKHHETLFTPKLPPKKILAIENIGYGTLGKIFFEFDESFWSEDRSSFLGYSFLWLDENKQELKDTNREWLLGVPAFYIVDQIPNLLEAFVAGSAIPDFENLSDEKLIEDTMWMLEKFLGKSLPQPKSMKRTKWQTHENFYGSYSYFNLNTQKFNVSPKDLAETLKNFEGKPKILFAGEATDLLYPSYANGAVTSGYRAGNELASYFLLK